MEKISFSPKNKAYFEKLLSFYEILLEICRNINIEPVIYGSLAYAFYTQDESININDIDILIQEKLFPEIIKEIEKEKDISYQKTNYNSLKVFYNEVKITFDSMEHYYSNLPKKFHSVSINNHKFKIIGFESLKEVYSRGAENIPSKREEYKKKLDFLAKI